MKVGKVFGNLTVIEVLGGGITKAECFICGDILTVHKYCQKQ